MDEKDTEDAALARRRKNELRKKSEDKNKTKISTGLFSDETYLMGHKSGKCIIFNHTTFSCGAAPRPHSGLDADALQHFFENRGFDVKVYSDKKVSQIYTILETVSQEKEYHKVASSFVCCVLTHGELRDREEYLYAEDNIYPTDCLFAPFIGNRCKWLAGKPKMFFIEACRGDEYDPGVYIGIKKGFFPILQAGNCIGAAREREPSVCFKIPVKADFLTAYSTAPKSVAWKRNGEGSWFIQVLCAVLEERADDSDLLSMLTVVCRKVAYEYESCLTYKTATDHMKQVPSLYSTLTKMVKFPPKIS